MEETKIAKRKTHTSTEVKKRYMDKTYKIYNIKLRLVEDAKLIELIEEEKSKGYQTTEAFRNLLTK